MTGTSLKEFFEPPNQADSSNQGDSQDVATGLENLKVLAWKEPSRLPRWYVLHRDLPEEQLREELLANVGITDTDFCGQWSDLSEDDMGDTRAARVGADYQIVRIELLNPRGVRRVENAFRRMLSNWGSRPWNPVSVRRPIGELVAGFQLSIRAGNRTEAEQYLQELRDSDDLEALNQIYLELEFISSFEGAAELLAHQHLASVLQIRRPARVSDLIARAIDQLLLRFDASQSLEQVLDRYRSLGEPYRSLLVSPAEARSSSGLLLVALGSLTRSARLDLTELGTQFPVDELTQLAVDEAAAFGPEASMRRAPLDRRSLGALLEDGHYTAVLEAALQSPPTEFTVDAALRAAQWLDSVVAAQQALAVLSAAPPDTRAQFAENRLISPLIRALEALAEDKDEAVEVSDWNRLLQYVLDNPEWDQAVEAAKHGAMEWATTPVQDDAVFCTALASNITQASEEAGSIFSRLVPHLIEWLDRVEPQARPHLSEVHEALIAHFSFRDSSRAGLELLGSYAADVLSLGLTVEEYRFCLECLEIRWGTSASPAATAWASDVLEALVDQPCADEGLRIRVASALLRSVASFSSRVTSSVLANLRQLASLLNLESLLPAPQVSVGTDPERSFENTRIGIYSLTPGALQRAKAALEQRLPGVDVETRSDHVASDELRSLARSADVMVVVWRSATHSATGCIATSRPAELPTLRPGGKGSASIISAVEEWLASSN